MTATFGSFLVSLFAVVLGARPELVTHTAREWLSGPPPVAATQWVRMPRGVYRPLFPASPSETEVVVAAHELAKTPVTNRDFLGFVERHPEWQRDQVPRLFADAGYLSHWAGPTELGAAGPERPVTNVSWFAAKAYCEELGARLPTEAEWERAAAASPSAADGRKDPRWSQEIIAWYSEPSHGPERDVGRAPANFFGVQDLNGLVWEWVLDFNSTLVTSDSRNTRNNNRIAFCGAGALGAQDPENYVSFMRTAFRSSLRASFAARHLGFRCARDAREEKK